MVLPILIAMSWTSVRTILFASSQQVNVIVFQWWHNSKLVCLYAKYTL